MTLNEKIISHYFDNPEYDSYNGSYIDPAAEGDYAGSIGDYISKYSGENDYTEHDYYVDKFVSETTDKVRIDKLPGLKDVRANVYCYFNNNDDVVVEKISETVPIAKIKPRPQPDGYCYFLPTGPADSNGKTYIKIQVPKLEELLRTYLRTNGK